MSDDLISRSALKAVINEYIDEYSDLDNQGYHCEKWCAMKEAEMAIDNAPTVEVPENTVNCVLTMFGKCSYNETGCSDCEIKDKIRKALERPHVEYPKADSHKAYWDNVGRAAGIVRRSVPITCRRDATSANRRMRTYEVYRDIHGDHVDKHQSAQGSSAL